MSRWPASCARIFAETLVGSHMTAETLRSAVIEVTFIVALPFCAGEISTSICTPHAKRDSVTAASLGWSLGISLGGCFGSNARVLTSAGLCLTTTCAPALAASAKTRTIARVGRRIAAHASRAITRRPIDASCRPADRRTNQRLSACPRSLQEDQQARE